MNAALFAGRERCKGCTLYLWPFPSCSRCAVHMVQVGIKRHVAPKVPKHLQSRWGADMSKSVEYYNEAGVDVTLYDNPTDGYIKDEIRKAFGLFFTLGDYSKQVIPTELIEEAITRSLS